MNTIRRDWLIGSLILVLIAGTAHAGSDYGSEGGGNKACMTTSLPAGIWSLVSYDNAGQPCVTKPDADQTCDPTATWNWKLEGHLIVTNQPQAGGIPANTYTVEMQEWIGNGGGSCHGGSANPIICDNPSYHYLQESARYYFPGRMVDLSIPFSFLAYHLAPWFSYNGDGNFVGVWVFVKPSIAATCRSTNYGDTLMRDEAN